jgi:sulfite dehydrogenase (quinone) subunit SoeC
MHPAPSVILFSTLSGLGFGFLAILGWGVLVPSGWAAFFLWGLGYGLAVAGLLAATFHLGNPKNGLKAFTQWRTSWLSREAWASVATLLLLAPVALSDMAGPWPAARLRTDRRVALALVTVLTTGDDLHPDQGRSALAPLADAGDVPAFALAGGAMLAGTPWARLRSAGGRGADGGWRVGDGAFARAQTRYRNRARRWAYRGNYRP